MHKRWFGGFVLAVGLSGPASAGEHPNLQVLDHPGEPRLKKAMKDFSRGLGVKCARCHIKNDFASEAAEKKGETRAFFAAVVERRDPEVRAAALAELLEVLELPKPKNVRLMWRGIDAMKRKPEAETAEAGR